MAAIHKILIVGLSLRSGLAASHYLLGMGKSVTASDSKSIKELTPVIERLDRRVEVIGGPQEPAIMDRGFDLVVLSPGVPRTISLIREAERRGVPVIAEVELAYQCTPGSFIGITGTDGKTTTTSLTGHLLKELGFDAQVGGNIGIPLISLAEKARNETVTVAELSSFQLEMICEFRPSVAAILNVTPDHLDRYPGMDEYLEAKIRIAMNQEKEDFFIANGDDPLVMKAVGRVKSRVLRFSLEDDSADAYCRGGLVRCRYRGEDIAAADRTKMKIVGMHNVQNAMAAILMTTAFCESRGVAPDFAKLAEALYGFKGLEHRMEPAGEWKGRSFINDSKATTIGSVSMALRGFNGNCVLILGGRTKGDDYSRLVPELRGRVRGIVLIGESRPVFTKLFSEFSIVEAESMNDAVARAMAMSEPGDAVLLSPACASFDMYDNYEERGRAFKAAYEMIKSGALRWT